MSVPIEAFNVVVGNEAIAPVFPGGVAPFRRLVPNRSFCTDGRVRRVGFMAMDGLLRFVEVREGGPS